MSSTTPSFVLSHVAQLQLISYRGVPNGGLFALGPHPLNLDVICDLLPMGMPDETRCALSQCQLSPFSTQTSPQWWLRNLACAQHCEVNAQVLACGQGLCLQDGDIIEIGLVQIRFLLKQAHEQDAPKPSDEHKPPTAPTSVPDTSPNPAQPPFQLTELARLDTHPESLTRTQQLLANPLADVIDAVDATRSLRLTGVASAQEAILGPPAADLTPPSHIDPAALEPDTLWAPTAPESAAVMTKLHQQYLRLMNNPNEPVLSGDKKTWTSTDEAAGIDLATLMPKATQRDIYGILGHPDSIEDVLRQLDTLADLDILAVPGPVDVLRLFAPTNHPGTTLGLPPLTRHDHHSLTVDSAMPLTAQVESPETGAPATAAFVAPTRTRP